MRTHGYVLAEESVPLSLCQALGVNQVSGFPWQSCGYVVSILIYSVYMLTSLWLSLTQT